MDAMTLTPPQAKQSAYTTPKRVQAWFLGRSRDRWKKKYASLKARCKRLGQRVADVCTSRARWRSEAEAARREAQELRNQNAALQAELGARADETGKKREWPSRLD
jgi:hypothetical protein